MMRLLQPSSTMEHPALHLDLEHRAEDIHEPDFAAYAPLVPFDAILSAQRLFGWVRLDADRLTDLLNAHDLVRLTNVLVEEHRDGRAILTDETILPRSEIIAVIASGPRGDPMRRLETIAHAVTIEWGDYRVGGFVHAPPGVDPELRLRDGGPMVPLTEAWLQDRTSGRRRDTGRIIIVNCGSATRVEVHTAPAPVVGSRIGTQAGD